MRSILTVRVVAEPEAPDEPVVVALVDGADVLGEAGGGYLGFDPDRLLGPGRPLLPTVPPRRVAVYRCGCGESGCACVSVVIRRDGDEIVWSDARDITGAFPDGPIRAGLDPWTRAGKRLDVPELRFTAVQYEREVARATADRSWESDRRRAARFVAELLREDLVLRTGHELVWLSPDHDDVESFGASLRDPRGKNVVVRLRAPRQEPAAWATLLVRQLLEVPPHEWVVTFRQP